MDRLTSLDSITGRLHSDNRCDAVLYNFAIALFVRLELPPIVGLIFEQTRGLLQKWLLYGIGTLFSMGVLAFFSSLVLQLTLKVAEALWASGIINGITDLTSEGFTNQSMQQGGIGLLMTVLIVSSPPLAAMLFQGTVGNFLTYSAFGMGHSSKLGPQGQPPGSYGGGGYRPSPASATQANSAQQTSSAFSDSSGTPTRLSGASSSTFADAIRPAPTPSNTGGAR